MTDVNTTSERDRYLQVLTAALEASIVRDGSITSEKLDYLLQLLISSDKHDPNQKLATWLKSEI